MQPTDWRARLFFVVLLGWPTHNTAFAQSFPTHSIKEAVSLYSGATCLESNRLADAVERVLSTDTIDARIRVEVRGDRQAPNVVSITIWRVDQAYATRSFDDAPADCAQLHSLVGLAIAFAIDATWLAKKSTKQVDSAPPPVEQQPAFVPRWALGFDAALSGGAVLGLGTGVDVRVERSVFSWLDLRLSVLQVFSLKQSISSAVGTTDVILSAGQVDACGGLPLQPWLAARACLGAAVGGFTTIGREYDEPMTDTSFWLAGVGGIDTLWTLWQDVRLVVAIDGVVPIRRHRIEVIEIGPLEQVDSQTRHLSRIAVMARIGPLFYFP